MSEEPAGLEKYAQRQIKTSTDFAFDPKKPKTLAKKEVVRKARVEALSFKDRVKREIAKLAAELGPGGKMFAVRLRQEQWARATADVQKKLQKNLARGRINAVARTLEQLDPVDTKLSVKRVPKGWPLTTELMVRATTGLPPNSEVEILRGKFTSGQDRPSHIVIGGQLFPKKTVRQTLQGDRNLKPMVYLNQENPQILIPLRRNESKMIQLVFLPLEKLPQLERQLTSLEDVVSGSHTIPSPDHPQEDMHFKANAQNNKTPPDIIKRGYGVIDGVGSSARNLGYTQDGQSKLIYYKGASICARLKNNAHLPAKEALKKTHEAASAPNEREKNPAFAAGIIAYLDHEKAELAWMGDCSAVGWSPQPQTHRRSAKEWPEGALGGPSPFQLLNFPHNGAQLSKAALGAEGMPTKSLDTAPGANQIYSAIGDPKSKAAGEVTYTKEELRPFRFLILATDGLEANGRLLDPDKEYSQDVFKILKQLARETEDLCPEEASKLTKQAAIEIAKRARRIYGENDDITVTIIDLKNWHALSI
ncbi:PP2C family serine/threonine-protein phosphatase [Patescibacteria group bacterium]